MAIQYMTHTLGWCKKHHMEVIEEVGCPRCDQEDYNSPEELAAWKAEQFSDDVQMEPEVPFWADMDIPF